MVINALLQRKYLVHLPKFDPMVSQCTYEGEYVKMSPMYPLYRNGEWVTV